MIKFGRNYRLTIQDLPDTPVTDLKTNQTENENPSTATVVTFPITCSFNIKRGISNAPNSMDIQLINLSKETRDKIFQDRSNLFSTSGGSVIGRKIQLEAGYGDDLSTIFKGNLFEAGSTRRGADIITYINATDGGYDTNLAQVFQTYKGTIEIPLTSKQLIESLIGQFPTLQIGAVADDGIIFTRPVVCNGLVYENLKKYAGDKNLFIDLEKVYYLRDFEIIEEEDIVIDASTGLLDTPNRQNAGLFLTTLFEPAVALGRMAQLKSSVLPIYDGRYKINSINHECVMSGAIGGECKTTLGLILEGQLYGRKFEAVPAAQTRNSSQ